MSKETILGQDARKEIQKGINLATKAVAPTLGAVGMTMAIDFDGLDPVIADDGVSILRNLYFKDKYQNVGLKILRKAAIRTSTEGGDGTATTTVLTNAFVNKALELLGDDSSKSQEIKRRLQDGLKEVLAKLAENKREVSLDDIEKVAIISSLDPEIAKLIAEVIKEVGVNGLITVEKGSKIGYSYEIVKGARINSGLLSPYFINNPEKEECVLENPFIFLADRKISLADQIKSVMKSIYATGTKSLLIIADDVEGLAMASIIQNSKTVAMQMPDGSVRQGEWDIACIKNPYTASRSKDFLRDIAALTGGTVVSEEAGMKLDTATHEQCGRAEKVIVTKDTCMIIGGGDSEALQERIKSLENKIDESISEYEKDMLKERLACLTGGIGVIRVGTYTDMDFHAKKLKFDNAINSTQAALQEGILPGGGIALFEIAKTIEDPLIKEPLFVPFYQQVKNAGISSSNETFGKNEGYNFKTGEQVNMFDAGIIDTFKVTRLVLESAIHIASTVVTLDGVIVESEK